MVILLLWIYKEELVLVEFFIWTKYRVNMPRQRFDPNMFMVLEIRFTCTSPYYLVEKYIMAYCQEILPVPTEDSWIVPLDIIQRKIPHPYINLSKPGKKKYKRQREVDESFPTRKNKCSVCRDFGHEKATSPTLNAP